MEMSISYMWRGKDKMDDNGLKAMKYIQRGRGFPYRGMYSCLFLSKCSISILSDTISHLNSKNQKIHGINAFFIRLHYYITLCNY